MFESQRRACLSCKDKKNSNWTSKRLWPHCEFSCDPRVTCQGIVRPYRHSKMEFFGPHLSQAIMSTLFSREWIKTLWWVRFCQVFRSNIMIHQVTIRKESATSTDSRSGLLSNLVQEIAFDLFYRDGLNIYISFICTRIRIPKISTTPVKSLHNKWANVFFKKHILLWINESFGIVILINDFAMIFFNLRLQCNCNQLNEIIHLFVQCSWRRKRIIETR